MTNECIAIVCFASFTYLVMISFMMSTSNFISMLTFKMIPFCIGIANLIVALKMIGVV